MRWQSTVSTQGQIKLVKVLPSHKSRIKLNWQLVKFSIETILHDIALAASWEKRHYFTVLKLIYIDGLVDLRQSDYHWCLHAATTATETGQSAHGGTHSAPTWRLSLEKIVLLDHKVIHQLDS